MEKLVNIDTGEKHPLCAGKGYTLIGRHRANDIVINRDYISEFHCTIFRHDSRHYLLDHSINGTFYPVDRAGPISIEKRIDTALGTVNFLDFKSKSLPLADEPASHREARRRQNSPKVPKIIGFAPHLFSEMGDIRYLLTMIEDPETRALVVPVAREMRHETVLGITMLHRFLFIDDVN